MNTYTKEMDTEKTRAEKMGDNVASAIRQGEEKMKNASHDIQDRLKEGQEQLKKVASAVDKQLHENPWPIVAGVAAGCLLLGFLAGSRR